MTSINDRPDRIQCGVCGCPVPSGGAHIAVHWADPDMHVMYCPACCPYHAASRVEGDAA